MGPAGGCWIWGWDLQGLGAFWGLGLGSAGAWVLLGARVGIYKGLGPAGFGSGTYRGLGTAGGWDLGGPGDCWGPGLGSARAWGLLGARVGICEGLGTPRGRGWGLWGLGDCWGLGLGSVGPADYWWPGPGLIPAGD